MQMPLLSKAGGPLVFNGHFHRCFLLLAGFAAGIGRTVAGHHLELHQIVTPVKGLEVTVSQVPHRGTGDEIAQNGVAECKSGHGIAADIAGLAVLRAAGEGKAGVFFLIGVTRTGWDDDVET